MIQQFLAVINNFLYRFNVDMKQKLKYIKNINTLILLIELLETARRKIKGDRKLWITKNILLKCWKNQMKED